jgi:CRISP-associated protein Cas1
MCTLYLTEQGSKLRCTGRRLIVTKEDEKLIEVPVHKVDTVVIEGHSQITSSALALLLDRGVSLVLSTMRQRIRGMLQGPLTPAVELRQKQYALSSNADYCRRFSENMVRARAANFSSVLKRFSSNHPGLNLRKHVDTIGQYIDRIQSSACIDSLRGYEGIISREYFAALVSIFSSLGAGFEGRIKRPPTDPVNSCLSYIYVILTAKVAASIETQGLDVFCGLMHKPNRNAPALALDLVEQFRQPIADRFVMYVFNKRILSRDDFDRQSNGSIIIKKDAKSRMLEHWERFLLKEQKLTNSLEPLCPQQLIKDKIYEFKNDLLNSRQYAHFELGCWR